MENNSAIIDNKTLSARVYDMILNQIIEGKLKINERICSESLAKSFGVSRTPVREAIKSLEKTGLVEFKSYSGAYVRKLTVSEIEEIYRIRLILETYVVEQVIEKASEDDIKQLENIQREIERVIQDDPKNVKEIYDLNAKFHMTMYRISGMPKLCEIIETLWINLSFYRYLSASSSKYPDEIKKEHNEYLSYLKSKEKDKLIEAIQRNLIYHMERVPKMLNDYYLT